MKEMTKMKEMKTIKTTHQRSGTPNLFGRTSEFIRIYAAPVIKLACLLQKNQINLVDRPNKFGDPIFKCNWKKCKV